MKTIFKIVAVVLFIGAFTACVQDDDYSVPAIEETGSNIANPALGNHSYSFATVIAMQTAAGSLVEFNNQVPQNDGKDSYITGYVISNDEGGNIYKSIYIQDAPENPTAGIKISVDAYDTYIKYNVGRKVYVKLNGLAIDDDNGVITIGVADGTSLARISALDLDDAVQRDSTVETIVAKATTTGAVNGSTIPNGILIEIPNMQVPVGDLGATFANIDNTFSVNRNLISCDDNGIVVIRNSGYSDFKTVEMAGGKGTLTAILSKYNSNIQLFVREPADLDFTGPRCDPLFSENFNTLAAWTVFSVTGAQDWYASSFGSTTFAKISGFTTSAQNNEDWLVSPAIDLSTAVAPVLNFDNVKRYNGPDVEVLMSTYYAGSGDPTTATWTTLPATLDTNTGSWTFVNSGDVDISAALGGNVYIAFKYTSTTAGAATIEIDNLIVKEL